MPTPTPAGSNLRQLAEREQRVFATYPLVARYFPAAAIEDARQRLARAIERGDGPGIVIGAPGTGKSLLLQVLATQYHSRFDVVLLACARLCTRRAMLQAVLFELGLPYKMRDEGDLRLSLLDHLLSEHCPSGLLLLVDEAQALPTALLDELRILTNLVRGGVPRVRLVLAGSSTLEEAFAHPELESFSQRLSARCYLAPLNRDETWQYIRGQLAASSATPEDVFVHEAAAAVFEATDGVPRLVNQLCDRALQFAAAKGAPRIDRATVQEAWSDLQQIPTPWEAPIENAAHSVDDVIEFGKLSSEASSSRIASVNLLTTDDDTEIDGIEELEVALHDTVDLAREYDAVVVAAVDPFSEKFDEEEVVLDNFAGWDAMFRPDLPRVENRRDPGFSTLVQAAIAASPVSSSRFVVSSAPAEERASLELPAWPRLRLAEVSESAACDQLTPKPLVSKSPKSLDAESLADVVAAFASRNTSDEAADAGLLIIEDDAAQSAAAPPVRREEYRNLFSRLRSG